MKKSLPLFFLLLAACAASLSPAFANPDKQILVDPGWLDQHKNNPGTRIIELAQNEKQYSDGHIPQAIYINWLTITDPGEKDRYNLIPKDMMEDLLGKLGISNENTIVLYDDLDNRISTRMFWSLRYYGHRDIRILDGGKQGWKNAGMPLVPDIPDYQQTTYRIRRINHGLSAELDFIQSRLNEPGVLVIDGRPPKQYTGEIPGRVFHTGIPHLRKGHVTGAVNVFWKENFNKDGTFKSRAELQELYNRYGATPDKTIITYCNEGLHASPPWFVLKELLGYPDVRLYDDSMSEWANLPDTPMNIGDDP